MKFKFGREIEITHVTLKNIVLALMGVVVVLGGGVLWRLSLSPVDISFLKSPIENALYNEESGRVITADALFAHWPNLKGPLLLGLKGVHVSNVDKDQGFITIDEIGFGLDMGALAFGHVRPAIVIIKRPELRLIRRMDGSLDFGFDISLDNFDGDDGDKEKLRAQAENKDAVLDRILAALAGNGDVKEADKTILSSLRSFRVENATLYFDDQLYGSHLQLFDVDAAFSSADKGLDISLSAGLDDYADIDTALPRVHFKGFIDAELKQLGVQGAISNLTAANLADLHPSFSFLKTQDGALDIGFIGQFDARLYPLAVKLKLASLEGFVSLPSLYDAPVPYADFALSMSYHQQGDVMEKLSLSDASVRLRGVPFALSGDVSLDAVQNMVAAVVRLDIAEMDHAQIAPLWPKMLEGDNSELWVVKRLSEGTFSDVFANLQLSGAKGDDGDWSLVLDDVDAGFDFDGMKVDYRAPLPAATGAKGQGSFDYRTGALDVTIDSAKLGDLDVSKGSVKLANIIEAGAGTAEINVQIKGALTSILDYVSNEPIDFTPDFDVASTKGAVDFAVSLSLPTRADVRVADVKVSVDGSVSDIYLPEVVRMMPLSGDKFKVSIADGKFYTSGKGMLAGQVVDFAYDTYLSSAGKDYSAKVTASMAVDSKVRDGLGIDLSDFISGAPRAEVVYYSYQDGRGEIDVKLDLLAAKFFVEPFGYMKNTGEDGALSFKVLLQDGALKSVTGLVGSAPDFALRDVHIDFKTGADGSDEVEKVVLGSVQIGKTFGAGVIDMTKSGLQKISFNGSSFDLRPFMDDDAKSNTSGEDGSVLASVSTSVSRSPMQISINAEKMITGKKRAIHGAEIYADIDRLGRFNQLEMDARVGSGALYLRFKPDPSAQGKRTFRLEADDAGETLRAFNLYDNVVGGKIVIYAEPIGGVYDRNLIGLAEMTDFSVVKAPTLARLFGILSLGGVEDLLENKGLTFDKLEAKFDWLYRRDGSLLVLQDGRTSGNSVGLTFDGVVDQKLGTVDISGTVAPMSSINRILSAIPLVGDLLSGGSDGGVFAATYEMKGTTKDPDVSVNPLSVLTPGIIRRILFE